jgi:rSAM/selenodomain-associated transferase 1
LRFPDARILIFAKSPVPGQVKTRLIPALGSEGAAALQRRLVARTLAMAMGADLCPVHCWYWPDLDDRVFAPWRLGSGISFHRQPEGDLGARMGEAAARALTRCSRVVLIGTDCPLLDARVLAQALELLDGREAALGPAEDGGYVLLGLRRVEPQLFQGIDWGTDRVLEQTRARFKALDWHWAELSALWDLDRPADLARLRARGRLSVEDQLQHQLAAEVGKHQQDEAGQGASDGGTPAPTEPKPAP